LARNAKPRGLNSNWNALVVGLSYIVLAFVSLGYYMHRSTRSRRRMAQLSVLRPSGPQLPWLVDNYVSGEYARACAIAFASLPNVEKRPGWGSPGSIFEGVRFRTAILDTIAPLHDLARQVVPHLPKLQPRQPLLDYMIPLLPLIPSEGESRNCLHTWIEAVEMARDYSSELNEECFVRGMQAAGKLTKIFDEYNLELLAASTNSSTSVTAPSSILIGT